MDFRKALAPVLGALLLAGVFVAAPARASVTSHRLYVESAGSGGSDTSDCQSSASPCASITYAIGQAQAGDIVELLNIPAVESVTVDKDLTLFLPAAGNAQLSDGIVIASGVTLTLDEACGARITGVIAGAGNLAEDDRAGCSVTLSPTSPNTYSGTTEVEHGEIDLLSPGALPVTTDVTIDPSGILNLGPTSPEIHSLAGSGSVVDETNLTVDSTGISPFDGTVSGIGGVAMSQSPSLLILSQPSEQVAATNGAAVFQAPFVSATGSTSAIQWQSSTDSDNWANLTDGGGVSGSSTPTLTIANPSAAMSGTGYRALLSLGSGPNVTTATTTVAPLFVSVSSPAPAPPYVAPFDEPLGTYRMALSFQPGAPIGGGCVVLGRLQPRCGGIAPDTDSFTDPITGVTYTVDASNAAQDEGLTISGYEVDTSTVSPSPPAGTSYVVGFAVEFSPGPDLPSGESVTLTITDPAIRSGDAIYAITPPGPALHQVAAATTSGTVTITFSQDPIFMVAHSAPAAAAPTSTRQVKLIRLCGVDRIATAIAISQYDFPAIGSARAVVLGRDDLFADDLAGSPFAAAVGGPLLLSDPSYLDPRTATEIARVLPAGGTVYLLGETSALSGPVESALAHSGYRVVRVGGPDRYVTAADVAGQIGSPSVLFEADGTHPGGAVSAAPAAIAGSGAILLTAGPVQSAPTSAYLAAHPPTTHYAVGNRPVTADGGATPLAGADDDATSAVVAQKFFVSPTVVGIATDGAFPDALTGAATSEGGHGPTLLVPTAGPLPPEVAAYLQAHPSVTTIIVYGGTAAVSDVVANLALQASQAAS